MRFALLGDHRDGLDMARALVESGQHRLVAYSGPALGLERLARWGVDVAPVGDIEEILANPLVDALIVASGPALRGAQLRRALQSERHVLCVHPADPKPDVAYEAALMRQDTGKVLLPLLPEGLHPAFHRFRALTAASDNAVLAGNRGSAPSSEHISATAPSAKAPPASLPFARQADAAPLLGKPQLLIVQRWLEGRLVEDDGETRGGLPGWDVLRVLGGDVAEITGMTPGEELDPDQPLLLTGRFLSGLMFQWTLLPRQAENRETYMLLGSTGRMTLEFDAGWPGAARLTYCDASEQTQTEDWPSLNPWPPLREAWQDAVRRGGQEKPGPVSSSRTRSLTQGGVLTWQDEIRAAELDDAVRRSVARRRTSVLDYQDVTEEATFKGAMTLLGCSLLWLTLALLILSVWAPWLGWFIPAVVGLFLLLQFLGWAVPPPVSSSKPPPVEPPSEGASPLV